jgi:hypothetical protein
MVPKDQTLISHFPTLPHRMFLHVTFEGSVALALLPVMVWGVSGGVVDSITTSSLRLKASLAFMHPYGRVRASECTAFLLLLRN